METTTPVDDDWGDDPQHLEPEPPEPPLEEPQPAPVPEPAEPEPDPQTALLPERPRRRRQKAPADDATGTAYAIKEVVTLFDADADGDTVEVTAEVERGQTRAAGPRAAIADVIGERAGAFKAVPLSSDKVHRRRETVRLEWDD